MARPKKGSKENPVTTEELAAILEPKNARPFKIVQANIKDDFCIYVYEVIEGLGLNDTHKVDGKGIILDDMRNAFSKFRVHLAAIDGAFQLQGIEPIDIDKHHGDEITGSYHVTGFKIRGSGDNESIILIGNKYISGLGGRMELVTPKIAMDSLSSYKWYNELKTAADQAREEVALYKEGKCRVIENEDDDEEDKPRRKKSRQLTIVSAEAVADNREEEPEEENTNDDLFESPI